VQLVLEIQAVFWSISPAFIFITGWQNGAEWNNELSGLTRHKILLKDHEELPTIARQRETKENATAELLRITNPRGHACV
jgi:hypothetical protein